MAYINSSQIKIYPSAYRNGFDPESYLNTEYNLTHTKALSSVIDSFAFEKSETEGGASVDYIYIYLKGYYFKCSKNNILSLFSPIDTTKPIWAQIKINTESISAGGGVTYTNAKLANLASDSTQLLDSSDATPKFQGIAFTNAESATAGGYSLKVLEYNSSTTSWVVPAVSKTKLSSSEILNGDAGSQSIDKQFTTQSASIASANITSAVVGDITSAGSTLSINHKSLTLLGDINLPANSETNGTYVYGQIKDNTASPEVTSILVPLGTGAGAITVRDANGKFNADTATLAASATDVAGGEENTILYQTAAGTTGFITKNEASDKKFLSQTDGATPVFSFIGVNDLPSIPNSKLSNSSISLWGTSIALGGGISNTHRLSTLKTKYFKAFADTEDDNADANYVAIEWSSNESTALPTLRVQGGNINCNGNIQGATVTTTSDARLKENVISYTPEKSILDLDVKKFDFINGEKNQIGCIAQDLKEICPEIVSEDENGYLSIQESKIVYLLLNEVKKLKEELEKISKK